MPIPGTRIALSLLALGLTPVCVRGKTAAETPIFRATTRVVLVDVVATDGQGQAVHDLKARDFIVMDNGKPQNIVAFGEHRADAPLAPPVALNLPENVHTNYVSRGEPGALTVLLFDSLNTDPHDLTYARNQMLNFLKKLSPGARVALYALGPQLRMVHNFTENSEELIAAAEEMSAHRQMAYSNAKDFSAEIDELKHSGLDKVPGAVKKAAAFLGEEEQGKVEWRLGDTLDVFTQLAHALAVVPGRKNLIWISRGFPFDLSSDTGRFRSVAALLAANRIAVYPVDARGVVMTGPDAQASGSEVYAQRSEGSPGQDQENAGIMQTMRSIAEITGGRAHFNTNDLAAAMADSMRSGSNYYTLAYRPSGVEWNGQFRKIAVKTSRPHVKLHCRSGYYAISDPSDLKDDPHRVVAMAMQPDVPVSTQFIMKARVIPPEIVGAATKVDIFIDIHDLALTEENGQKTPKVYFVAVAWDHNRNQCGSFSEEFHTVSQAQYESLLHTGLQVHQDMALKPGSYQLRLGVMDGLSGRIGTMDVPLTVGVARK